MRKKSKHSDWLRRKSDWLKGQLEVVGEVEERVGGEAKVHKQVEVLLPVQQLARQRLTMTNGSVPTANSDDDPNVWIECDICEAKYHLQCSGIDYDADDYWTLDTSQLDFVCHLHL